MARTLPGEVRTKILEAARERMWHYGFRKTTIDEVAADAGVGKGTVYLYFESKEDIALALLADFKEGTIERMQVIASDRDKSISVKLTEMLAFPILKIQDCCDRHPGSVDVLLSIRPHILRHLRPYIEREIAIIAEVLESGNQQGLLDAPEPMRVARLFKHMVSGFWPPYPRITNPEEIEPEIAAIVALAIRGLRNTGIQGNTPREMDPITI